MARRRQITVSVPHEMHILKVNGVILSVKIGIICPSNNKIYCNTSQLIDIYTLSYRRQKTLCPTEESGLSMLSVYKEIKALYRGEGAGEEKSKAQ
jgi:hypothetical protein